MNSKYFWLPALIIVIIAAIGVVFYVPDQNTSLTDTSTWPIYRNEKYGFMMKYPPEWSFSESTTEPIVGMEGPKFKTDYIIFSKSGYKTNEIELSHQNQLEIFEDSFDKILNFFLGTEKEPDYLLSGEETHNGIKMKRYYSNLSVDDKDSFYIFQRSSIVYVFHTLGIFAEPMLDSFVFLK